MLAIPSAFLILTHLTLTATPWGRYCYYSRFTEAKELSNLSKVKQPVNTHLSDVKDWVGQKVHVVFSVKKKTFLIFTSNFIELGTLSMLALSCVVSHWLFPVKVLIGSLSTSAGLPARACPARNLQQETSQTTFDTFDQSQHLLHTRHKSFLCFSCTCTFLEMIKHNKLKMLPIYFHLLY